MTRQDKRTSSNTVNMVLVGPSAAGKSTALWALRDYCNGERRRAPATLVATAGIDVGVFKQYGSQKKQLHIYDTGGVERYYPIHNTYLSFANVVVYFLPDCDDFTQLLLQYYSWYEVVSQSIRSDAKVHFVGRKGRSELVHLKFVQALRSMSGAYRICGITCTADIGYPEQANQVFQSIITAVFPKPKKTRVTHSKISAPKAQISCVTAISSGVRRFSFASLFSRSSRPASPSKAFCDADSVAATSPKAAELKGVIAGDPVCASLSLF